MRTFLALSDANCTWCLDDLVEIIQAEQSVDAVHLDQSSGCLVVDHHGDDLALVALVRDNIRGWEPAGNGEAIMVTLDASQEPNCRVHKRRQPAGHAPGYPPM